jgi:hypothetical protein
MFLLSLATAASADNPHPSSAATTAPAATAADAAWKALLARTSWTWQSPKDAPPDWQTAFASAEEYRRQEKLERPEFLAHYQAILDAHPPADIELLCRLEIGQALVSAFEPFDDQQGLAWFAQTLEKFKDKQWQGQRTLMVVKINCADLIYRNRDLRPALTSKMTALYEEVLDVPEDDIVFNTEFEKRLNLDQINNAQAPGMRQARPPAAQLQANQNHRARLLQERKEAIDSLRLAAARALVNKQAVPRSLPLTRANLVTLKNKRPDDPVYQSAVDEALQKIDNARAQRQAPAPPTRP